ncbi:cupin domain-containing protein [Streptomyces sp. NPDC001351]|uniref:cupin domain-containing protein n=1 Tax=Streptomyces sp. NPDC001351 TaxID=3364564 RepID=UPI0036AF46CE
MADLFDLAHHLIDLAAAEQKQVIDDIGVPVRGITGASGAAAVSAFGPTMGLDLLELDSSSSFPLHVHEGDHLLYVLEGTGAIHIDGVDHWLRRGQSIFVPAVYPHGLRGPDSGERLRILSFSTPHHPIDSAERMTVVHDETRRPV